MAVGTRPPFRVRKSMLDPVLEALRNDRTFMDHVRTWTVTPPRDASFAPMPETVEPRIAAALSARGITRLYSHQAEAIARIAAGEHVVVVTPTASGKTLTYNLPVLSALLADPDSRALYLFPTKALSQDQQSELNATVEGAEIPVGIMTFDGDTPPSVRTAARARGQIIITNPDMLHAGIMPNHAKWSRFFQNLKFIVIDELHTYRGIFGSHVANVIRRLRRITAFYGASPQFVMTSATIGNPAELAQMVIGEDVSLVATNGAPSGARHTILYNPPLVDRVQGIRQGVVHASERLAVRFLKAGVKTIVFARSRQRTELIAGYIRKRLENPFTENGRIRVESYRGGYLPNERRAIERGLRDGTIDGVVSTNALELGIDIGSLDAAILAGFPGTIASTLQQAGRAGRRASTSVAVVIASSSPLDQYIVEHAEYVMERSPEAAYINADNPFVLFDQLKCALFELPMAPDEPFGADTAEMLGLLEENGVIRLSGGLYHWSDRSYPAEHVSLRSATSDNVIIVDGTDGAHEVIGEMDRASAKELLFDNAIYIHRGAQYVVRRLDIDNRRCDVERTEVNYFTDALVKLDLKVLTEDERRESRIGAIGVGDVLVRSIVAKFKKIRFASHENIGYGEIDLPEEQMHTRAAVIVIGADHPARATLDAMEAAARPVALNRLARLVRSVAPAFLMSSASDIGVHAAMRDPHFGDPAIYLYDRYPGGSGLSDAFIGRAEPVLSAAHERVTTCTCSDGCPSCVGPPDTNDGWDGSPRAAVRALLGAWLGDG